MLNIITLNIAVPLPRFLKTLFLSTFLLLYQGIAQGTTQAPAEQATNPFLDSDVNRFDGVTADDAQLMFRVKLLGSFLEGSVYHKRLLMDNLMNPELINPTLGALKQKYPDLLNHDYNDIYNGIKNNHNDIKDYEYKRVFRHIKDLSLSKSKDYETEEYKGQKYYKHLGNGRLSPLERIKASSMYVRGGTGAGVTVAVFDESGASPHHPDLAGKYAYIGGFNPIERFGTGGLNLGHGTHIAGIIAAKRNDIGMHGVAYDAKIASYRLPPTGSPFDSELKKSIDKMGEMGALITNNSWSRSGATILEYKREDIDKVMPTSLPAYKRYVSGKDKEGNVVHKGGVQVWAAGNTKKGQVKWRAGLPYHFPDLKKGWLAVVAVGYDGEIASYSNKCGVAAEWCLAAPGGDEDDDRIYSTVPDGDYDAEGGTSMAAPHVSGALAGLRSMREFSDLTYHQLRYRIRLFGER